MSDLVISSEVDLSKVRGAFAEIQRLSSGIGRATAGGGAFKGQISGAQQAGRAFQAAGQAAASAGAQMTGARSRASQFFRALQTVGAAGNAIGGIEIGVKTLSSVFAKLRGTSAPALTAVSNGVKQTAVASNAATTSTKKFLGTLAKGAAVAGTAAVAIWGVHKAWKALSGVKQPNLKMPKAPSAGGGMGKLLPTLAIGAGVAALGAGIFAGLKNTVGEALKNAAAQEQLQISFEVLSGGLAPAKKALAEIRTLSENTPLSFVDLADAGRKLLAFQESAETVPDTLRKIGDISSGIQAPIGEIAEIFGKARVQGTLFAEDINQLTGRGIPVLTEFANILGTTPDKIKKMASEGKLTFPILEQAFTNLTSSGGVFFKMMERQSTTVSGLMSTFKDRISSALTEFGKPINDALRPLLKQAVELVGGLKEKAAAFGVQMANAIDGIRAAFQVLGGGEIISLLGKGLMLAFKTAVDFLARAIGAVTLSLKDGDFLTGLSDKIRSMGVMLKDILLAAVEASLRALGGITGLGPQFSAAADNIGTERNLAQIKELNLQGAQKRAGMPEPDLLGILKDNFDKSSGVFGKDTERLMAEIKTALVPVLAQAEKNRAERQPGAGEDAAPKPKQDGLIPAASGGVVVGAFQRAVNLVQGKTVNEMVVAEGKKTNELLKQIESAASKTEAAAKKTAENTGKDKEIKVQVVPAFA